MILFLDFLLMLLIGFVAAAILDGIIRARRLRQKQLEESIEFCREGVDITTEMLAAKTDDELAVARKKHEDYKRRWAVRTQ